MVNLIVKGIFWIITQMFNIIFAPIFAVIYALFPQVDVYFSHISAYLQLALTYVRSILSLLLIDDTMILYLFNYFVILYSIHYVTIAIKFAINIYHKFRP